MVLVGRATRGFPEGAAPPMAAIFTRGSAHTERLLPRFDLSIKSSARGVLLGVFFFIFLGCGLVCTGPRDVTGKGKLRAPGWRPGQVWLPGKENASGGFGYRPNKTAWFGS